jgi:hypothetical protein
MWLACIVLALMRRYAWFLNSGLEIRRLCNRLQDLGFVL